MRVLAVEREGELVRMGLADEAGAGLEQVLHDRRGLRLDAGLRQHERRAGPGRIALDVEEILHRQSQPGEGPGDGMLHRRVGIRDETAERIVESHLASDPPGIAVGARIMHRLDMALGVLHQHAGMAEAF